MQLNSNAQVRITSFIMTQTGTYQEQNIRPFDLNVTAEAIDTLRSVTQGGRNVGVSTLQGVAGSLLKPSAMVESQVHIAEGWRSRRFRFMMTVHETMPFKAAGRTQRVFFGYTDQCDASFNHLDPKMRIYFNSETVVEDDVRPTPNGPVIVARVGGANQIVSPLDMSGRSAVMSGHYASPTSFLIRPEDIYGMGQTMHVADKLSQTNQFDGPIQLAYVAGSMVGSGGVYKYSDRTDTAPVRYLERTLNGYKHAVKEAMMGEEVDSMADKELFYGQAQSHVTNQDISSNTFFALLKDRLGFMECGYVTLEGLMSVFPELNDPSVMMYSMDDGRSMRKVNHFGDSQPWNGADNLSVAAATLAQVVPAIMMDNFIRSVSFAATNGHRRGEYLIDIHAQSSRSVVDNLPMLPYFEEFQRRLIVDVLNTITYNNQLSFRIGMSADLAGDSVIDIELDNDPLTRFIAPTFSDSLFSPIITNRQDLQSTISSDMLYLVESTIDTNYAQATQPHGWNQQTPQQQPAYTQSPVTGNYDDHTKFL